MVVMEKVVMKKVVIQKMVIKKVVMDQKTREKVNANHGESEIDIFDILFFQVIIVMKIFFSLLSC